MLKKIKDATAAVVEAIAPKPTLAELTDRLRAAKADLTEARKKVPADAMHSYSGLPDPNMVGPVIACCRAAMVERDASLAFVQGDTETAEVYAALCETLRAKDVEARRLEAAAKAAQDALDAFDLGVGADVAKATDLLRAITIRRVAEDLPGARTLHDSNYKLSSMLGGRELAKAAEWLSQPVPGLDGQPDWFQIRINEIERGHAERERREALACCPAWQDADEWVARWRKADREGREDMKDYARGERREGLFTRKSSTGGG
ncbi:MAG TPA: hypothetical protein VMG12_36625 [Polyangiaceae bacterium]|nr:hypothetical protein [Polyangiaceae bacterium]